MLLYVFQFRTCFNQDSWGQARTHAACPLHACALGGWSSCHSNCGPCSPPDSWRATGGHFAHAQCDLEPHWGHKGVCPSDATRIPELTHVMTVAIEKWACPRTLPHSLSSCT